MDHQAVRTAILTVGPEWAEIVPGVSARRDGAIIKVSVTCEHITDDEGQTHGYDGVAAELEEALEGFIDADLCEPGEGDNEEVWTITPRVEIYNVVSIPEIPDGWPDRDFVTALQSAVDGLEAASSWVDLQEEITYIPSVHVRVPRPGEIRGTYRYQNNGQMRLLDGPGSSKPQALTVLMEAAFNKVCGC